MIEGESDRATADIRELWRRRWQEVARRFGLPRASVDEMHPAFEHEAAELARGLVAA